MKDVARELERRQAVLTLRLRANVQRMLDGTAAPGANALGVVRRHPILSLGGAALAGVLAGKYLRGGGDKALRVGAAVLGGTLRYATPILVSALSEPRR
jgi:hypothetical protein